MRQLISIIEIADTICEEAGDVTKRYRATVLRHLARCYRDELRRFISNETDIATFVCPVSNIIDMPSDFIYETKVGIKHGDRIVFLEKNYEETGSTLLNVNQTEGARYIKTMFGMPDEHLPAESIPFYNYKGDLVLHGYGTGLHCDGMYSVDRSQGRIAIGSLIPPNCEVVVEYVCDSVGRGINMVPVEFESSLFNYGLWKLWYQRNDPRWRQSAQDYEVAYYQLETLYKFVPINFIVKLFNQETHTVNNRL